MKKKLIVGCIGIVLMFLVMSVASAAMQKTNFEKAKASPLFKIRIQNEIQEISDADDDKEYNKLSDLWLINGIFIFIGSDISCKEFRCIFEITRTKSGVWIPYFPHLPLQRFKVFKIRILIDIPIFGRLHYVSMTAVPWGQ